MENQALSRCNIERADNLFEALSLLQHACSMESIDAYGDIPDDGKRAERIKEINTVLDKTDSFKRKFGEFDATTSYRYLNIIDIQNLFSLIITDKLPKTYLPCLDRYVKQWFEAYSEGILVNAEIEKTAKQVRDLLAKD